MNAEQKKVMDKFATMAERDGVSLTDVAKWMQALKAGEDAFGKPFCCAVCIYAGILCAKQKSGGK